MRRVGKKFAHTRILHYRLLVLHPAVGGEAFMSTAACWRDMGHGAWLPRAARPAAFPTYDYSQWPRMQPGNPPFRSPDEPAVLEYRQRHNCSGGSWSPQCHTSADRFVFRLHSQHGGRHSLIDPSSGTFRRAFCDMARKREITSVSYIGDSILLHQYLSLLHLLGLEQPRLGGDGRACWSCLNKMSVVNCTATADVGNDQARALPITLRLWRCDRLDETARAEVVLPTLRKARSLTVLSVGAHYSPTKHREYNHSLELAWRDFVSHLRALADAIANETAHARAQPRSLSKLQRRGGRGAVSTTAAASIIVWRTSPMGHPGCAADHLYRHPAPPEHILAPPVLSNPLTEWLQCDECSGDFGWQQMPAMDELSTQSLEPLGVRTLDVTLMTRQRPDSHTAFCWRKATDPTTRWPPDCLHYALPGVPDWWNAAMLSALNECE